MRTVHGGWRVGAAGKLVARAVTVAAVVLQHGTAVPMLKSLNMRKCLLLSMLLRYSTKL